MPRRAAGGKGGAGAIARLRRAASGISCSVMSTASAEAAPPSFPLPEGVRAGTETLVRLTAAAGTKVRALMAREAQGDFLRIAITGGGCNGLSYQLKFVPAPRRGDLCVETGGARVLVDSRSALYLKGTHVDYSAALVAGGFKFSNPNAKASCSCGESFSL
jgi:iron-sulfur cluster assembly protein